MFLQILMWLFLLCYAFAWCNWFGLVVRSLVLVILLTYMGSNVNHDYWIGNLFIPTMEKSELRLNWIISDLVGFVLYIPTELDRKVDRTWSWRVNTCSAVSILALIDWFVIHLISYRENQITINWLAQAYCPCSDPTQIFKSKQRPSPRERIRVLIRGYLQTRGVNPSREHLGLHYKSKRKSRD